MKYNLSIVAFLLVILCACSGSGNIQLRNQDLKQWKEPNGKVKVLSTIAMIGDLVKRVGGDHIDNFTLITGELDPHSYQLVKGDDEKLAFAQLIFSNGLGLEHGPSLQRYLANDKKVISLGNKLKQQNPELLWFFKGQIDPHIWMDVSIWSRTVPFIVEALSKQDPEHTSAYQDNGKALIKEMQEHHDRFRKKMMAVPDEKRYLVTSHDAFNYFTRAYLATDEEITKDDWQERFAAPEGLAPESQLGTNEIQNIINHMSKYQIQVLFPESNVSKDSIRKIVNAGKEKNLTLCIANVYLYGDAMGSPGSDGDTYLKMIEHNINTLAHWFVLPKPCEEPKT